MSTNAMPLLSRRLAEDFVRAGTNLPQPVETAAKHKHILDKINLLWPAHETVSYIDGLLLNDRASRAGFAPPVLAEIMAIKELHITLYPVPAGNPFDCAYEANARPSRGGEREADFNFTWSPPDATFIRAAGWGELKTVDELRLFMTELATEGLSGRRRIGEILVKYKVLTAQALNFALEQQQATPKVKLGEIMISKRLCIALDVEKGLALQGGAPLLDLDGLALTRDAVTAIPLKVAKQTEAIPVAHVERRLVVAVGHPLQFERTKFDFLEFSAKCPIHLAWADPGAIARRLGNLAPNRSLRHG